MEEVLGTGTGAHGVQPDGVLSGRADVAMQHRCHNELDGGSAFDKRGGGASFFTGWNAPVGKLLIAECMTGMEWYPNLAGRFSREWSSTYWPCKAETIRRDGRRAFFSKLMWSRCKPRALAAHDAAHDAAGGTPPFLLRMMYPRSAAPKVVAVVRNPTERLETSYWLHPHYPREYGATADGLDAYVVKHLAAFRSCEAAHGTRRCAFLFENLERSLNTRTFFACDQVIRGIYWPFLAEWRAAFGSGLLVLRAEEMMDAPSIHRPRLLTFLGLSHQSPPGSDVSDGPPNYAAMHAVSLKSYSAKPMHNHTRQALDAFFAPHNRKLADLLGGLDIMTLAVTVAVAVAR